MVAKVSANVIFSRSGLLAGARSILPLTVSVFAYGLVFGVLARQAGLNVVESILMSGLVTAGSSQFVALALWQNPLPVAAIIFTTLVVNLRYILMGAALGPYFSRLPALNTYLSLFFMGDENWALTIREFEKGEQDAAFLLGSGVPLLMAWLSGTATGRIMATALPDPAQWGLDFTFTAVFVVLIVGMWKGRASLWPWSVAAVISIITAYWLPGPWYILLGSLIGSLAGAMRDAN